MEHRKLERYPIGNPARKWKQDNFILSTFSARGESMRKTLETLSDAGFNLAEMGWVPHEQAEEALHYGEQLGIDILFQDFSVFGGMQERNLERHIDEETAKSITEHIKPYRRCLGYYVWDEPYVHDQLVEASRQCEMFRKYDPERLAFTVAIPSYNSKYTWQNGLFSGYLEDYCKTVNPEVLSLDYYPIGLSGYSEETQLDNSLFWCDLGLMRKLCAEYTLPLWFYYQALPMHGWANFTFPMERMMMYSAVMYGAKGLQQYTACGSTTDEYGRKSVFFSQQKEIHREFRMLGNTLMALNSRYVFHSDDLLPNVEYNNGLTENISESTVLADNPLPKRTSVGELIDDYGNTYLLILNRDYSRGAEIALPLRGKMHVYLEDRNDGYDKYLCDSDVIRAELEPGDAALFRVQNADDAVYTLEYILCK